MYLLRKLPGRILYNPQNALRIRFFASNSDAFPDVPTSAYYDECVNAAGRDGDLEKVRQLLNKRMADGCFNTTNTFKFIANTENSLPLLEDLHDTLTRVDKGLPRKHAFDTLIARLCKLKRIDESLRLVNTMARGSYGLTAVTFHPILNALTREKKMEEAWRVVELMKEVKVSPDLTAFNYFLTAYCVYGDLTSASEVLKKIEENKLRSDARTFDALVLGLCRAGKVEGGLMMVRRMLAEGQSPFYSTHTHVITALVDSGYFAQAVKFVMVCSNRDLKLDAECFGVLASKLIGLRRYDEAKFVLMEMKKRGLQIYGDKLKKFSKFHVKDS